MSLPRRYARLILNATNNRQAERWDVTQIHDELERLRLAQADPQAIESAELLAEEIAAGLERDYEWHDDSGTARIALTSGAEVRILGNETGRRIVANLNWSTSGRQERKKVGKWIGPAGERCVGILKRAGWQVNSSNIQRRGSIALEGTIRARRAAASLATHVAALSRVVEELSFE